jgi:two-component system chemotaxis response regulator CheB
MLYTIANMISGDDGRDRSGQPSSFACPKCHGALLERKTPDGILFRCRTGHEYSLDSLETAVRAAVDQSLWIAIRSLEESRC